MVAISGSTSLLRRGQPRWGAIGELRWAWGYRGVELQTVVSQTVRRGAFPLTRGFHSSWG